MTKEQFNNMSLDDKCSYLIPLAADKDFEFSYYYKYTFHFVLELETEVGKYKIFYSYGGNNNDIYSFEVSKGLTRISLDDLEDAHQNGLFAFEEVHDTQ